MVEKALNQRPYLEQVISKLQSSVSNFDNLTQKQGIKVDTVFQPDGSITETLKDSASLIILATRTTTFPNGNVSERYNIYDSKGQSIIKTVTKNVIFNSDGSISEEVI